MSSVELEIHPVGKENPKRLQSKFDIVFIHGLGGDWKDTWTYESDEEKFWPVWLEEDLPDAEVQSIGYPASPMNANYAMPLGDRAKSIIEAFKNSGLGQRPMIVVTHSLGGLVFKQLYRRLYDSNDPAERIMLTNIKGVAFFATPHTGSNKANLLRWVSDRSGGWASDALVGLLYADDSLRDLNEWYREHDELVAITRVYYETKATGVVGLIVDQVSADGGIGSPIPIDGDHLSICKPSSRSAQIYQSTLLFCNEVSHSCIDTPQLGNEPSFQSLVAPESRVSEAEAAQGAELKVPATIVQLKNESSGTCTIWLLGHEAALSSEIRKAGGGWVSLTLRHGETGTFTSDLALDSPSGWYYLFGHFSDTGHHYLGKRCLGLHKEWTIRVRSHSKEGIEIAEQQSQEPSK